MIFDLHELLQRAAIPGPYVLVGHSFGGLLVRLFAHWYRGDTAGLVLVDSMHEDQFAVFGPRFPAPTAHDSPALSQLRAFWTVGWREPNSTTEGIDFPESIAQAQEIAAFGQLPIEVLTAGTFLNQALVPERAREPLQHLWNDLQQRFLTLTSNSVSTFVPDSGHFMQRDRPDKVIEAIHRVEAGVRQAEALPGD